MLVARSEGSPYISFFLCESYWEVFRCLDLQEKYTDQRDAKGDKSGLTQLSIIGLLNHKRFCWNTTIYWDHKCSRFLKLDRKAQVRNTGSVRGSVTTTSVPATKSIWSCHVAGINSFELYTCSLFLETLYNYISVCILSFRTNEFYLLNSIYN